VFDLRNLSFHFSDTNISKYIASYAHSLAGRSIHILSLSFCNFVGNEGGSGFLTLGGFDEKVLFENTNVFENSCRNDHQLFRVHSNVIFALFTETAAVRSPAYLTVNSAVIVVPVLLGIASLGFWLGLAFAKHHFPPGRAAIPL
jgi:hypothetical protein